MTEEKGTIMVQKTWVGV